MPAFRQNSAEKEPAFCLNARYSCKTDWTLPALCMCVGLHSVFHTLREVAIAQLNGTIFEHEDENISILLI